MMRPALVLAAPLLIPPTLAQIPSGAPTRAARGPTALPPPHVLAYFEDSAGVGGLALDGGRSELEIADVDGDGNPDIVSVGDHGSPFINTQEHGVMVWLGDGTGGFALVQTGNFGYGGVAVGDVNGDGFNDVGYGVHHDYSSNDLGDQLLEVALGNGTGMVWTPWDNGLATNGESWGMFGTDLGDVDGDGDLDVGSNSFGCCAGVHVYANQMDGTWTQTFGFTGGNSDMDLAFCDFDRDGHLDLVAANSQGRAWLGAGDGKFAAADIGLPSAYSGVSTGDVDADGADELALIDGGAPRVFRFAGGVWTPMSAGLPGPGPYQATQIVDMDSDGRGDLLVFGNGVVSIFALDSSGGWSFVLEFATAGSGSKSYAAMRAGDVDHNGFPDIALWQDEAGGFGGINRFRLYREASVPSTARLFPVEPGPGRVWREGQARFVDWTAAVPPGTPATVDLALSLQGPAGPWTPLALGLPNSGRAQITVPSGSVTSNAWIRYTLHAGAATLATISRGAFEIR